MAETGARTDPFRAFRFEVRVDGGPAGGFSDCAGLGAEVQFQDYPEGGLNSAQRKFPTRAVFGNVTLKRGVVDRRVWDWIAALVGGQVKRVTVGVLVYSEDGSAVAMEVVLHGALPCKWTGPDLNAGQSAVAMESLELCHEWLEQVR